MRLNSYTDPFDNILTYDLLIEQKGHWQPLPMTEYDLYPTHILIKLEGCDTPEDAHHYTNARVGITRDQLPSLPQDEYYWSDLEGLNVINQKGILLGTVDHLFSTGANDVLVVTGKKEYLLPYLKHTILHVNLEKKEITVDWDEDF